LPFGHIALFTFYDIFAALIGRRGDSGLMAWLRRLPFGKLRAVSNVERQPGIPATTASTRSSSSNGAANVAILYN
jgi:hypothetical protein